MYFTGAPCVWTTTADGAGGSDESWPTRTDLAIDLKAIAGESSVIALPVVPPVARHATTNIKAVVMCVTATAGHTENGRLILHAQKTHKSCDPIIARWDTTKGQKIDIMFLFAEKEVTLSFRCYVGDQWHRSLSENDECLRNVWVLC